MEKSPKVFHSVVVLTVGLLSDFDCLELSASFDIFWSGLPMLLFKW